MSTPKNHLDIIPYGSIPDAIIDRYGLRVYTNSDKWILNSAASSANSINFRRIKHPVFKYAFSKYCVYSIQKFSPLTVITRTARILRLLGRVGFFKLNCNLDVDELEVLLKKSMHNVLADLRSENKLYDFYDLLHFYSWCSENIPECGFSPELTLEFSRIKIPGSPKGEAVRSEDPEVGPLHFELEEPLVRKALLNDKSDRFEHKQQRLAVAICLAYGRNVLNYARLREEDFFNLTANFPETDDLWQINIPRIKKRANPRELFVTETCPLKLASIILDVIDSNQKLSTTLNGKSLPRPLFFRSTPLEVLIGTDSEDYAFFKTTHEITNLISDWVDRVKLISPITNKLLHLSPRRLRYTFACNMVRQGASRAVLSKLLDHTDTQSVSIYFELFDEMVGMLDKALAMKIGKLVGWFQGSIVDNNAMAKNGDLDDKTLSFIGMENPEEIIDIGSCGEKKLCHLDPPYTCYLCPKFEPYRHADHERVLEIMLEDRSIRLKKYQNSKLGIQLDDVIFAVAYVAGQCQIKP